VHKLWCDFSSDKTAAWTLIHKTDRSSLFDHTQIGSNEVSLHAPDLTGVGILPTSVINGVGSSFRAVFANGEKVFWNGVPYFTVDSSHIPAKDHVSAIKISSAPGDSSLEDGKPGYFPQHGLCVCPSAGCASYGLCTSRSNSPGLWSYGRSGNSLQAGTVWVK